MSKVEEATRIVLAFNEAFNRHDVDGMMNLMSDNCIVENPAPAPDGTGFFGRQAVSQLWQDLFRESPQAHIDIEEIFGFGYRCVMRWKYSSGEGHIRGVDIFQIKDGLISEKLSYVKA